MKLRLSFQGLILLGCLGVVLGTLIFVAAILQQAMREQMVEDLTGTLHKEVKLAAELLQKSWPAGATPAQIDKAVDHLGEVLNLRVSLFTIKGEVLGDSSAPLDHLPNLENPSERPEFTGAAQEASGASLRYDPSQGFETLFVTRLMELPGKPKMIIRLAMPLSAIDQTISGIRGLVVSALLLGVLLSTGAAYMVSRALSQPVLDLTRTASAIAAGDFTRRLRRYPQHEVGELGRAFDRMADTIQGQIEEVTEARDHLEAILRGMAEGVLVTDPEGRILFANRALMELLELRTDPAGLMPSEILRNADLVRAMRRARRGAAETTSSIRTLGGNPRFLEVQVVRIAQKGAMAGCVAVLHDITEHTRTEQIRRDFVANVSHELRTPLTAIRGSAETLLGGALDSPEDARRFVEMIERQSSRLQILAQDLMDLALIESGQKTTKPKEISTHDLAGDVMTVMEELAQKHGTKLIADLPEQPIYFKADKQQLEEALINLIDNAIKYSGHGAEVFLIMAEERGNILFKVKDNGPGIPPEHLPRLFERFYRVNQDRSRQLGGTGLGLAIVKHLAQAQGGQVEVSSTPGEGSEFTVIIPLTKGI
jgi:two-component system phosphate regulon sensor histidine kinase PhoR